jgi:hypothetical protein
MPHRFEFECPRQEICRAIPICSSINSGRSITTGSCEGRFSGYPRPK